MNESPDSAAAAFAQTDGQLVEALAQDPTALGVLYDRYAGLVYGLALASLRNAEDARDLTQEIFLALYRETTYDPARGTLGGFLTTMTRMRAIDRLRARGRRIRLLQDPRADLPPTPPFSPLERISLAECAERVRAALDQLPHAQRQVLEMAYYRGLSQSEIASDLGASLGTVKSWARRGLLSLRQVLGDLVE